MLLLPSDPFAPPPLLPQVEYDSKFRLYLQTKLSNPHYKPEINAQTTLVNFCVTEKVSCSALSVS
jgi:hypothetical protein